jgi:alcohol dehydrogenase
LLACVKTAVGKTEMLDLPIPEPGPGEVVIKTSMATICGSDMHFLDELPNEVMAGTFPTMMRPEGLPMGHEGVGHIHAVGAGVSGFKEGDRVIASCLTACGKCHSCMNGDYGICTSLSPFGSPLFGCQAEYFAVRDAETSVAHVPDSVSDENALLASDIMSAGFSGIERANAQIGDSVAIFAQGPLGLCTTVCARIRGCGLIVGVDTIPERLEIAKKFGANVVINPSEKDPVAEIMALTKMEGVDIAVEAVGTQPTFEASTRVVRRGGVVSSIGIYSQVPQLSMPTLIPSFHHRTIVTTMCPAGRDRMEHLLALLEHGTVDLGELFTHRMKISETPAAYDLFRSKADGVLKVALTP